MVSITDHFGGRLDARATDPDAAAGASLIALAKAIVYALQNLTVIANVNPGDVQIGAIEVKNATDDTRAKVGAGSGLVTADNALAVADPTLGLLLGALTATKVTDPDAASASANALARGILAALGLTTGAAVITDANGTIQQYLRGLIKQWIAGTLVVGAGTNLIGKIAASQETSVIYEGATALTPKFKVIDHATSGDNTIIAAVADKKIRVLSGLLVASAAVTARFESGAGGTALTGQMQLAANGGFQIPYCQLGNFETATNTLLNLELSGAVSVDGWLTYAEVT